MAAKEPDASRPAAGRPSVIRQRRVAESVAAEVRTRILADDIRGDRLPTQDQLVREFGVSPQSIREALIGQKMPPW